jgi:hypothetical protein
MRSVISASGGHFNDPPYHRAARVGLVFCAIAARSCARLDPNAQSLLARRFRRVIREPSMRRRSFAAESATRARIRLRHLRRLYNYTMWPSQPPRRSDMCGRNRVKVSINGERQMAATIHHERTQFGRNPRYFADRSLLRCHVGAGRPSQARALQAGRGLCGRLGEVRFSDKRGAARPPRRRPNGAHRSRAAPSRPYPAL